MSRHTEPSGFRGFVLRAAAALRTRWSGQPQEQAPIEQLAARVRHAEARAQALDSELRAILDTVPAVLWITRDPACREIKGSRASYDILRLPTGANPSLTGPHEQRPAHFEVRVQGRVLSPEELPVQRAARGEEIRNFEEELRFSDGTSRYLLGNAVPLLDDQGVPSGAVSAFIDITERKEVEQTLRAREAELASIINRTPFMLTRCDDEMVYRFASRAYGDMMGKAPHAIIGRTVEDVVGGEAFEILRPHIEAVLGGESVRFERSLALVGVGVRVLDIAYMPTIDAHGAVDGWVGSILDVTERRQIEDERERLLRAEQSLRREAEAASRLKDEFLATISHELRTPLNAMLGWAAILRSSTAQEANFSRGVAAIERNARAQAQLVEDLLDVSSIISGKLRLDVRPVLLSSVVQAAVDAVKPAAQAKSIELTVAIAPAAEQLQADGARLQQIVWNLLSNSVKFTPEGGRIDVRAHAVDGGIEVSVSDSGAGINPDFLPFVFDRFRQADASTTRRHGGLGLGLAIARHLVEMHGGTIRASSDGEGRGAAFTARFPTSVAAAAEPFEGDASCAVAVTRHAEDTLLQGVRVLAVEDSDDTRQLMEVLLERCGAIVRTARTASDAFALLLEWDPDVLVSDIGLPDEDGYAFLGRVRKLGNGVGHVPAIALSGYARPENRTKALESGFQLFVPKPVEAKELTTAIATLARGRRVGTN